jgi:hypothetical protein
MDPEDADFDFFAAPPVPTADKRPINAKTLAALAEADGTPEQIAAFLGMSLATYQGHLDADPELAAIVERGRAAGEMALKRRQYQSAVAGDDKMLRHLGEHRLGQKKDTDKVAITFEPLVIRIAGQGAPVIDHQPIAITKDD